MSELHSASSSTSGDSEDCFDFVELEPFELSLKVWVVSAVEEDE